MTWCVKKLWGQFYKSAVQLWVNTEGREAAPSPNDRYSFSSGRPAVHAVGRHYKDACTWHLHLIGIRVIYYCFSADAMFDLIKFALDIGHYTIVLLM